MNRPSSHSRRTSRGALVALCATLAVALPGRADLAPGSFAGHAPEPVVAVLDGDAGPPPAAVSPPPSAEELASIRERLDEVQDALARQSAANRQIFFLLFLALIILVVNIIVQQRRK